MLKDRRSRLVPFFQQEGLDVLLVEHGPNLRYLSGFSGSEGRLLLTRDAGWFVCDSRYTVQAHDEVPGLTILERGQWLEALASLQSEHGWQRIGFEAAHTPVSAFQKLKTFVAPAEFVALGPEFDVVRERKDSHELACLEQVARLASDSLLATLPLLKPGVTESELALALEFEMRRRGADGRGFDFIVASGERGAMPHGRASNKTINAGELVTIDFGAVLNGYHSDETVTVAVGDVDSRQREIYDAVRVAHGKAIEAVRPGMPCKELDAVARGYLATQGFGDYFGHGLGHGLGLEVHEKPTLSPRSDAVLEEGMVVTIEPGIYIPGWGGVRIEDTVVVTAGGCRLLTGVPKELMIV